MPAQVKRKPKISTYLTYFLKQLNESIFFVFFLVDDLNPLKPFI